MNQIIFDREDVVGKLYQVLKQNNITKLMVVCGSTCTKLDVARQIKEWDMKQVWFQNFAPNPTYESVAEGVELFQKEQCQAVLAIGGGSAMDVAKCIKLYSMEGACENYLERKPESNSIILMAIPTTAGTGSEATRFAIIYYKGEKQSVVHESILPQYVAFEPSVLSGISEYQRNATMMDTFCHAVESFWSVKANSESTEYARKALEILFTNLEGYLGNTPEGNRRMLQAANLAGKAINITQTTAGHAMCYKLTTLYGISHGHAAALCVFRLWEYMNSYKEQSNLPGGVEELEKRFQELAAIMGCSSVEEAIAKLGILLENLKLKAPVIHDLAELDVLKKSVNPVRLGNNPISLSVGELEIIYTNILLK